MGATETRLDLAAVRDSVSLRSVIEADIGPPTRGRKYLCPFHPDTRPSMEIARDGKRFRCWSCRMSGDVLDWVQARENLTLPEAARRLDPSLDDRPAWRPRRPVASPAPKPPPKPPTWRDDRWRAAAEAMVAHAEDVLWSGAGRPARQWLRSRGLEDFTIRRFRLGFLPDGYESEPLEALADARGMHPIWAPRGITIPLIAPAAFHRDEPEESPLDLPRWVGVNVRRLAADVFAPLPPSVGKCLAVGGSSRGYAFPWADLLDTQGFRPALICEGEIDAMVAEQEAGDFVHVVSVGGATQPPHETAILVLSKCPLWLLATDYDDAGADAALAWFKRDPEKAHRLLLPVKDIGEFHEAGGCVRTWLREELLRLGY